MQPEDNRFTCRKSKLNWNCRVEHPIVASINATIGILHSISDRVSVEVWFEGRVGRVQEELTFCRGVVSPRDGRARIVWLGRRNGASVHPKFRGLRCISGLGFDVETLCSQPTSSKPEALPKRTLAEAALGLVAAIAIGFGVFLLEMQVMDNGSGKLVQMYHRLGFDIVRQEKGELVWMEAPVFGIARLAPASWFEIMLPDDFCWSHWARRVFAAHRDAPRLIDRIVCRCGLDHEVKADSDTKVVPMQIADENAPDGIDAHKVPKQIAADDNARYGSDADKVAKQIADDNVRDGNDAYKVLKQIADDNARGGTDAYKMPLQYAADDKTLDGINAHKVVTQAAVDGDAPDGADAYRDTSSMRHTIEDNSPDHIDTYMDTSKEVSVAAIAATSPVPVSSLNLFPDVVKLVGCQPQATSSSSLFDALAKARNLQAEQHAATSRALLGAMQTTNAAMERWRATMQELEALRLVAV